MYFSFKLKLLWDYFWQSGFSVAVLAGDVMYKLKISVAYFCSEYVVSPVVSRQTERPRIRCLNDVYNNMMVINVKKLEGTGTE
jgi:hypothetical protein